MGRKYSFLYILLGSVAVFSLLWAGSARLHGQSAVTPGASVAEPNSYVFQLVIGGIVAGDYTECTGLGSSTDVNEVTGVTDSGVAVIRETPGALRWPEIRLRRSGLSSDAVWSWRKAMENGDAKGAFRDGTLTVVSTGPTNRSVAGWNFRQGWVVSLTFDQGMEQLIIAHQGLERVTPGETRGTRS